VAKTAYQFHLIKNRERDNCFKAFMNNNWVGAAIFGGLALDYLYRVPVFK
jgi:4-hydroxybenzoate polyprenyltransferase